jgi:hypothetical protein
MALVVILGILIVVWSWWIVVERMEDIVLGV